MYECVVDVKLSSQLAQGWILVCVGNGAGEDIDV